MKEFRVAIIDMYNNAPNEGMRCIKMLLDEFYVKNNLAPNYKVYNVRANTEVPVIYNYDAFISSGGPGSPLLENSEWEKNYFDFIDELIAYNKTEQPKKHLFAICHSFQLLYQHFNLGQVTKRYSTSFGVMPIHQLDEKVNHEPIFEGLEDQFWAVDSRDYQAVRPDMSKFKDIEAELLCIEKERPHVQFERAVMAIRFSDEVFGTQFHPEADAEGMHRLFKTEEKKQAVIANFGEEKYYDMIDKLDDADKIILTESIILPNFFKLAYDSINEQVLN